MKNPLKNERGAILIFIALGLIVLFGFVALVIDVGRMYVERNNLQKSADASALAGAQELLLNETAARTIAASTAEKNLNDTVDHVLIEVAGNKTWLRSTTDGVVDFTFARVLGFTSTTVKATAKVDIMSLTSYEGKGVIPLGIDTTKYSIDEDDIKNGTEVVLKWEKSESGVFGALDFGSGAKDYKDGIINGSKFPIYIGQILDTETGAMVGPTIQGFETRIAGDTWSPGQDIQTYIENHPDSPRIVLVPIYNPIETNGNQVKKVKVVNFGVMFIKSINEETEESAGNNRNGGNNNGNNNSNTGNGNNGNNENGGNNSGNSNNKATVTGVFINFGFPGDGDPDQTSSGAYTFKLVE